MIRPSQKLLAQLIDRGVQLGWREICIVAGQLLQPGLDLLGAGGGGDGLAPFGEFGGRLAALFFGLAGGQCRLGSSRCSSNTLDARLNLVQGLQQGFVGAERFSQGGLEGCVVAAGEANGPIELDRLSGPLLGG